MPTYEEAIRRVGIASGQRVLDIGCGTGVFLREVADHGAKPFGLDASQALLEIARERIPEADLRRGEMDRLPYNADSFDLVTGFNSFFFAADLVAALGEARRVAKPGAPLVIQVWGRTEHCDLEAQKQVARRYAPPPAAAQALGAGRARGAGERRGPDAGDRVRPPLRFEYSDDEMLTRLLTAPMGLAELAGPEREPALRRELVEALAPYRAIDGSYRLSNEFHYLVHAPDTSCLQGDLDGGPRSAGGTQRLGESADVLQRHRLAGLEAAGSPQADEPALSGRLLSVRRGRGLTCTRR